MRREKDTWPKHKIKVRKDWLFKGYDTIAILSRASLPPDTNLNQFRQNTIDPMFAFCLLHDYAQALDNQKDGQKTKVPEPTAANALKRRQNGTKCVPIPKPCFLKKDAEVTSCGDEYVEITVPLGQLNSIDRARFKKETLYIAVIKFKPELESVGRTVKTVDVLVQEALNGENRGPFSYKGRRHPERVHIHYEEFMGCIKIENGEQKGFKMKASGDELILEELTPEPETHPESPSEPTSTPQQQDNTDSERTSWDPGPPTDFSSDSEPVSDDAAEPLPDDTAGPLPDERSETPPPPQEVTWLPETFIIPSVVKAMFLRQPETLQKRARNVRCIGPLLSGAIRFIDWAIDTGAMAVLLWYPLVQSAAPIARWYASQHAISSIGALKIAQDVAVGELGILFILDAIVSGIYQHFRKKVDYQSFEHYMEFIENYSPPDALTKRLQGIILKPQTHSDYELTITIHAQIINHLARQEHWGAVDRVVESIRQYYGDDLFETESPVVTTEPHYEPRILSEEEVRKNAILRRVQRNLAQYLYHHEPDEREKLAKKFGTDDFERWDMAEFGGSRFVMIGAGRLSTDVARKPLTPRPPSTTPNPDLVQYSVLDLPLWYGLHDLHARLIHDQVNGDMVHAGGIDLTGFAESGFNSRQAAFTDTPPEFEFLQPLYNRSFISLRIEALAARLRVDSTGLHMQADDPVERVRSMMEAIVVNPQELAASAKRKKNFQIMSLLRPLLDHGQWANWRYFIHPNALMTKAFAKLKVKQQVWLVYTLLYICDAGRCLNLSLLYDVQHFSKAKLATFLAQFMQYAKKDPEDPTGEIDLRERRGQYWLYMLESSAFDKKGSRLSQVFASQPEVAASYLADLFYCFNKTKNLEYFEKANEIFWLIPTASGRIAVMQALEKEAPGDVLLLFDLRATSKNPDRLFLHQCVSPNGHLEELMALLKLSSFGAGQQAKRKKAIDQKRDAKASEKEHYRNRAYIMLTIMLGDTRWALTYLPVVRRFIKENMHMVCSRYFLHFCGQIIEMITKVGFRNFAIRTMSYGYDMLFWTLLNAIVEKPLLLDSQRFKLLARVVTSFSQNPNDITLMVATLVKEETNENMQKAWLDLTIRLGAFFARHQDCAPQAGLPSKVITRDLMSLLGNFDFANLQMSEKQCHIACELLSEIINDQARTRVPDASLFIYNDDYRHDVEILIAALYSSVYSNQYHAAAKTLAKLHYEYGGLIWKQYQDNDNHISASQSGVASEINRAQALSMWLSSIEENPYFVRFPEQLPVIQCLTIATSLVQQFLSIPRHNKSGCLRVKQMAPSHKEIKWLKHSVKVAAGLTDPCNNAELEAVLALRSNHPFCQAMQRMGFKHEREDMLKLMINDNDRLTLAGLASVSKDSPLLRIVINRDNGAQESEHGNALAPSAASVNRP